MSAVATPAGPRSAAAPRRRLGLDWFDWTVLAAFTALGFSVLAGLLIRVWTRGGVVTGADGFLVADPLQYLNWLRQAGEHGAIGNLYDLAPGPRTFVHPGLLISGLLYRLGLGVAAAYLAWKPAAIVALFTGALLWIRRFLARRDDRRLALVLALFACSPVSALVGWGGIGTEQTKFDFDFIGGELWPGTYLWGYLFTAIAVGLMPLALLAYERGRSGGRPAMLGWAAAAGLLCAWLQPWQGATVALVIVAAELLTWRLAGRTLGAAARAAAPVLIAIALPLAYYLVLSKTDDAWRLAGEANNFPRWPWYVTVLGLAPLAVPAAFAYAAPVRDFGGLALRAWPVAALVVFFQPFGTFPFHAIQGMTLPLVVLGLLAVRRWLGERPVPLLPAIAVAALLIVPGTLYRADELRSAVSLGRQPHFLTVGERDALRALDADPRPGGVLAPVYSGIVIPAYTGRETWIGAGSWTPDFAARQRRTEALFAGKLGPAAAARLVRESGARFVYADCAGRPDLTATLALVAGPPKRFGCAAVYEVRR